MKHTALTIIRNFFSILLGIYIGSKINMYLINHSNSIVPTPLGADVTTIEGLKASLHLFQPINFLPPFLAHAMGTFFGATIASFLCVSSALRYAMAIGFIFFLGGVACVYMLPAPLWYNVVDLVFAYFPFAFLGYWTSKTLYQFIQKK